MKKYKLLILSLLWGLCLQIITAQTADQAATIEQLAWRPHSNQVSLGLTDGRVLLHDLTNKETILLTRHNETVMDLAWNQTGTQLISVALDGSWHVWNAATKSVRIDAPSPPPLGSIAIDDLLAVAWSTDETRYAIGTSYGVVSILNADSGLSETAFFLTEIFTTTSATPVSGIAWNSDDTELYVSSAYGAVVWDVAQNRLSQILAMPTSDVPASFFAVDYSPQENALALGANRASTVIWDFDDGSLSILREGNASRINLTLEVQWGPFQQLLSVTREGQVQLWNVATSDAISRLPIEGVSQAVWSPYGGRIAYIETNTPVSDVMILNSTFIVPTLVPDPSLERLNAIADLCFEGVLTPTIAPADQDTLPSFVAEIEALPEEAIPTSCRARGRCTDTSALIGINLNIS